MKLLYRLYQLCVAAPILLVLTAITAIVTIVGCAVGDASFWSYYPGKLWSRAMIRILLLPVRVEGRENMDPRQSYVIVPNHQGAFDIFLVYGFLGRPFKWMMKHELRSVPLVGKASESAGFIFVDERGPKRIRETYARARNILKEGMSVVIFPEGARTLTGEMDRFKRGAFQLADELNLPLLPVTINGPYQVLPRSRGFNFVDWHPLSMTIHAPVLSQGDGPEGERATMDRVRAIIASALQPTKLILLAFLMTGVAACQKPTIDLAGTTSLHQLEGRTLYLKTYAGGGLHDIDSARIVHGQFAMHPAGDSVRMGYLFLGEQSIMPIVLDAERLDVVIDEKRHYVKGSALNDSLFAFIDRKAALDDLVEQLPHRESQMIMDGMNHEDILRQLNAEATMLAQQEEELVSRFIKRNMDNVLAPGVFMILTSAMPYPYMTPQIEEIVTLASPRFLADPYVRDFVRVAREEGEAANAIQP